MTTINGNNIIDSGTVLLRGGETARVTGVMTSSFQEVNRGPNRGLIPVPTQVGIDFELDSLTTGDTASQRVAGQIPSGGNYEAIVVVERLNDLGGKPLYRINYQFRNA